MKFSHSLLVLFCLLLASCAGDCRDCNASMNDSFGADWVIAQYRMDGTPMRCWKLKNTAVTNEKGTDGIYWQDSGSRNMLHLSGWYNRIQVSNGSWDEAAKDLNVNLADCRS